MNARAALLLLALPLISVAQSAHAEGERGVIDLRSADGQEGQLLQELRLSLGGPVALAPLPPEVLDPLRWRGQDPMRSDCATQQAQIDRSIDLPEGEMSSVDRFEALVSVAAKRNLFLDVGGAEAALELARYWVPCLDEPVPESAVATFLLQEALTDFNREGAPTARLFDQVVAVDPEAYLDQSMLPPVRRALQEAVDRRVGTEKVGLIIDLPGVVIDGSPAEDVGVLAPGRHVFQITSPDGPMRSRWVAVGAANPEVALSDLTSFALRLESDIRRELARDLITGELSDDHRQVLDAQRVRAAQGGDGPGQAFVLMAADTWALRVYEGDGVVTAVPIRTPQPQANVEVGRSEGPHPSVYVGVGWLGINGTTTGQIVGPNRLGYSLQAQVDVHHVVIALRGSFSPHGSTDATACIIPHVSPDDTEYDVDAYIACVEPRTVGVFGVGVGYDLRPTPRWSVTPSVFVDGFWLPQLVLPLDSIELGGYAGAAAVAWGPSAQLSLRRTVPFPAGFLSVGLEVRGGRATVKVEDVRVAVSTAGVSFQVGVEF